MRDRFRQLAKPVETNCEIVMRQRAGWFMAHNVSIMFDGFDDAFGLEQNIREICFHFGIIWFDFEGSFKMAEREIELAFFHESRTELEIRVRLVRMAHQHNLELRNRFIEAVLLEQEFAHLEMSKIVLSGYGKRSIPKPLGVVPVRSLNPRAPTQSRDDDWRSHGENFAPITKRLCKIDNRPRHRNVETD